MLETSITNSGRTLGELLVGVIYITMLTEDISYTYVNIDDCWSMKQRDPKTKRMVPDPNRFPLGMLELSKKIHALGLKFGIYSDSGDLTCQSYPGSLDYEDIDAKTFEDWEVDCLYPPETHL
jgi:alpha-galactosidase